MPIDLEGEIALAIDEEDRHRIYTGEVLARAVLARLDALGLVVVGKTALEDARQRGYDAGVDSLYESYCDERITDD